jgi:hypothetical protein
VKSGRFAGEFHARRTVVILQARRRPLVSDRACCVTIEGSR